MRRLAPYRSRSRSGGTTHDQNIDFSYNPAGQITQRVGSNDIYAWLDHWNIDASAIVNGLNQATSVGDNTVTYDAKGNVTSYDGKTYTYDAENFMTSGNGATIEYDAAGRFFQSYKSGTTVRRKAIYAGSRMIGLYKEDDTINAYFIHGAGVDEVVGFRMASGARVYQVMDERGSIIAAQPETGTWTTKNSYDAYGRTGGSKWGRFRYTGQMWSSDLEMHYYKARWYNHELGRFMQTDPIGYGDGMNMYGYVGGDPVNRIDPFGLESCDPKESEECEPTDPDDTAPVEQQQVDYRWTCLGSRISRSGPSPSCPGTGVVPNITGFSLPITLTLVGTSSSREVTFVFDRSRRVRPTAGAAGTFDEALLSAAGHLVELTLHDGFEWQTAIYYNRQAAQFAYAAPRTSGSPKQVTEPVRDPFNGYGILRAIIHSHPNDVNERGAIDTFDAQHRLRGVDQYVVGLNRVLCLITDIGHRQCRSVGK